jgi:hypothetical protein
MANAWREIALRKSPASASRGANAIECSNPSNPPHSRSTALNNAAIWSSRVTSQGSTGAPPKSAASLTTRSFSSSLT